MRTFLKTSDGWKARNILDVRPAQDFMRGHLSGATSLPLADCRELASIFLPPRHEAMLVVAETQQQADELAIMLKGRGRVTVDSLGWELAHCPLEFLEKRKSTTHLWSAPPWLKQYESWLPPPAAGKVLDLACGSGRAMVWLAQKGYRTVGLDWQPEALEMGRILADSQQVRCQFQRQDLRNLDQVPPGPWSVILNFRYLQRNLLMSLPDMLIPGGVAMVRTFRDLRGYDGHPHRKHRLNCGELLKAFSNRNCEIIAHEESFDPDGRPAAGIVVRRKII